MTACETGLDRLRASVPCGWRVADKTGGGGHATRNDIAVLTPLGRPSIVVTACYTGSAADATARNAILAPVGRIVSSAG